MIGSTIKVLLISTSSLSGGAAIAANRLMAALNRTSEIEATMLVRDRNADDPMVFAVGNGILGRLCFLWERGVIFLHNGFSRKRLFQVSTASMGCNICTRPEFKDADVVHIHWTQQGMLSLREMSRIFSSGKPVVWTFHDMWPCTGICHYSDGCDRYSDCCHSCKYLGGSRNRDLSFRVFKRKKELFSNARFTVVTCSRWLSGLAASSTLLRGKNVVCIPNPIDTSVFRPVDRTETRLRLGIRTDCKFVLFASQNVTDSRKGIGYLVQAARILKERGCEMEFVIMGKNSELAGALLPFPSHPLGYVHSPAEAAAVYSACDLFVIPSLIENLPNTVMEALACGIPCVGFDVGGIPEMIDHKVNGYVAEYKSAEDFARGILWCLDNPDPGLLRRSARQKAEREYSEASIAGRFIPLYRTLLQ